MRENQGYFALVQYSEYPERAEFVNIGVVLFANISPFVFTKFVERARRIERVFSKGPGAHFRYLKESLKSRLMFEFSSGWSPERVCRFIEQRSGKVRLSPARSVFVKEPLDTINQLFEDLVGELPQQKIGQRIGTRLKHEFQLQGVENLLDRPQPILLPYGVEIKAPYGYQNGSYNLIQAVALDGDPDHALERASPHMIEGRLLFEATKETEQKRLVVVADVSGQDTAFVNMVADQMENHAVRFYRMDHIDPLVADIRKNVTVQ